MEIVFGGCLLLLLTFLIGLIYEMDAASCLWVQSWSSLCFFVNQMNPQAKVQSDFKNQTNKKKKNRSKILFWELELIQISAVFARQWFIFVCGGWLILIALISYVINKIVIIIYLSHMMKSLVCQPLHSISVITFYFFCNIWIFHWWR